MELIDLTVPIGPATYSPPSVNKPIEVNVTRRTPGYWQVTQATMALHAGSHVDFTRHFDEDGETAELVDLSRTCGQAVVLDLGELATGHSITPTDPRPVQPDPRGRGDRAGAHRLDRSQLGRVPRLLRRIAVL